MTFAIIPHICILQVKGISLYIYVLCAFQEYFVLIITEQFITNLQQSNLELTLMQPNHEKVNSYDRNQSIHRPTTAHTANNTFSIDQSYHKFTSLRDKLRKITDPPLQQYNKKQQQQTTYQLCQQNYDINIIETEMAKSKQMKPLPLAIQQTQRKKRKGWAKQQTNSPVMAKKKQENKLLRQKQQALGQINRLLDLKKEYLNQIQQQLKKQTKKSTIIDRKLDETQMMTAAKVRAPDLYQIRQQKQRLKQKQKAKQESNRFFCPF